MARSCGGGKEECTEAGLDALLPRTRASNSKPRIENWERHMGRSVGYDLIKAVAAFMVVLLHVSGAQFIKYDYGWISANIYDSLTRVCVPLFFMVSGALLVPVRPYGPGDVFRRVRKIAVPLFVWSYLYIAFYARTGMLPYDWNPLWILSGPVVYHFWFFYSLIGIYLFLPVLQAFYHSAPQAAHWMYLSAAFIFASIIPGLRDLGVVVPFGIDVSSFPLYVGYVFAGAFLSRIALGPVSVALCFLGYLVCSGGTMLLTVWISRRAGAATDLFHTYHSPLVALGSVFLFLGLSRFGDGIRDQKRAKQVIHFLGTNAFGVYIFHVLGIFALFPLGLMPDFIHPVLGIPVVTATIFTLSLCATIAVRMLPFGKLLIP
jgi:surface polysaccharide O-acyltransferase-like enzyme